MGYEAGPNNTLAPCQSIPEPRAIDRTDFKSKNTDVFRVRDDKLMISTFSAQKKKGYSYLKRRQGGRGCQAGRKRRGEGK